MLSYENQSSSIEREIRDIFASYFQSVYVELDSDYIADFNDDFALLFTSNI